MNSGNLRLRIYSVSIFLLLSLISSFILKPTPSTKDYGNSFKLEELIPSKFDGWREITINDLTIGLLNTDQNKDVDKLYDQTFFRNYSNEDGQVITLAIAYGRLQTPDLLIHRPESCYTAQGFKVLAMEEESLLIDSINVPVRKMLTKNNLRIEPVTYFIRIGNDRVNDSVKMKLAIFKNGLKGDIPDGLLFRVSSFSNSKVSQSGQYAIHDKFIEDMYSNMGDFERSIIFGGV
ncbi:MAG: EpsI family protein [Gammaproteobacteria bacterium]|nr:EpsI family protein [Gammaproteobacteria bacterium]